MDGTRDQPPGKTAENWSRKDGIRAGSVTGPWRSVPRAEAPRAVRGFGLPGRAAPPGAPVPPIIAHDQPARPVARGFYGMVGWIAFGGLAAALLVAAAFLLRPAPPPDAAGEMPAGEQGPAVEAGVAALPEGAPAPAATAAPVRLRVGPGITPERQAEIVRALEAAGYPEVQVEALPFRIATTRIGYYREADRPAAEALAREIAPALAEAGDGIGVRDYSQLLADPEPGRLDLWIEG